VEIPGVPEEVLKQEHGTERAQHRGLSIEEGHLHQRQAQVFITLRRIVHHSGYSYTRALCADKSWRRYVAQHMERRPATQVSILLIKRVVGGDGVPAHF
jgi:hypothetical protein